MKARAFARKATYRIASFRSCVLSSVPMKRMISSKIMVLLLLSAFLATCVGNTFGFAWCVGNDGHVGINYVSENSCCVDDNKSNFVNRYDVPSMNPSNGDHCGLCLDFSAQSSEAVFLKRLNRIPLVSIATVIPNGFPQIANRRINLVADNLVPQFPPRVSQAILAHRTVVILS